MAVLIDGGYFLKRLPAVRKDIDATDVQAVTKSVLQLIQGHLNQLNEIHRAPAVDGLTDDDFSPAFRQKGVDMRIGLDIASITLKRQANIIVLVSGDADFVPAAKLARREGVRFLLDPLWQDVPRELLEHIDGLRSGFYNPRRDHPRAGSVEVS